ncbi:unnamed protein product [Rhizoctonia solani]|uniref:Uncharacterized protein n=1 Tax=Rhizoctonia solani TaxID=456999 RepID=A0A8H3D093_9AGAM|nr:unnamed protein product [Rhizoctonia solani]
MVPITKKTWKGKANPKPKSKGKAPENARHPPSAIWLASKLYAQAQRKGGRDNKTGENNEAAAASSQVLCSSMPIVTRGLSNDTHSRELVLCPIILQTPTILDPLRLPPRPDQEEPRLRFEVPRLDSSPISLVHHNALADPARCPTPPRFSPPPYTFADPSKRRVLLQHPPSYFS